MPRSMNKVVADLRRVAEELRETPTHWEEPGTDSQHGIYFPPKEKGEAKNVQLKGYVPKEKIADHLYYIADMLEQ